MREIDKTGTSPRIPSPGAMEGTHTRTTARLVGGFYILATVAGVASVVVGQPVPETVDHQAMTELDDGRVVTGALLEMLMGVAVAAVAIAIHPVLRRFRERLAHGYIVARTVEGACYAIGAVALLTMVASSRTAADDAATQPLGNLMQIQRDLMGQVMGVGAFTVSAFILYWVLFRTRLVPRWLSVWGLIAAVPFAVPVLTTAYGLDLPLIAEALLHAPLGVQEMVLAGWLIVRGFDAAGLRSAPAETSARLTSRSTAVR